MNRTQWISIGVSVLLVLVLYFVFDTKPRAQKELEKTRLLTAESTDITVLLKEAKESLGEAQTSGVLRLESAIGQTEDEVIKADLYKQLSGEWYDLGQYAIAGYYAQQVAELEQTEDSWSIAGTTYTIALQRSEEDKIRDFSAKRAVEAYESAISINPENAAHQVNLAMVYAEQPPEDNPMRGVQMLLQLNNDQPDNVIVLIALGRLGLRTGQYERAIGRLEKAVSLDPQNPNAVCLLAQAYEGLGLSNEAAATRQRCADLSGN
jgi:Flp pilus assembly protein TadD